ncbi:MAG: hypothetical protein ISS19_00450 [Bacteroidales bacterium]|nr:hypothetical protein [Bacteroidales bacterium]
MKKSLLFVKPIMIPILVFGLTMLFSGSLLAQDTVVEKPRKVVKVKVDLDEEGESFTIDTSYIMEEEFNMEEFEEAMKEYKVQMKDVGKYLQEMNFYRGHRNPHRLEYLHRPGNRYFFGRPEGCYEPVRIHARKKGESLNDVLGDIPMSAVKSYKIKETKNGKRIIIDVSDDAFIGHDEEDIIIWHGDIPAPPPPPRIKKEVFIEKQVDREEEPE